MTTQHDDMLNKIRQGAVQAFGEEGAQRWLNRTWRVFDDRTPVDMARCENDGQRVLDYVSYLTAAEKANRAAKISDYER